MSVREQTWNHLLKNLSLLEKMPGKQLISLCPEVKLMYREIVGRLNEAHLENIF